MNITLPESSANDGQIALVEAKTRLGLFAAALTGLAAAAYVAL